MTRKFVVLKAFADLEDNRHIYGAGKFYPREGAELNEDRADALSSGDNARNEKLIVEVLVKEAPKPFSPEDPEPDEPKDQEKSFPKHTGGGYYELSNGEKVKGKEKANEAEEALK
ncbi:hypothetical protein [Bacillus sp. FSL K6-3431]|uniref:hypothetical protein n=1 Tax=Bacillus sp. FSL K6-3431 TaxID=2921500 RepID=UPI0030F7C1E7